MSDFIRAIKKKFSSMQCSVHNKQPDISINGDNVSFTACCPEFGAKCKSAMTEAVRESASSQLKNIFKKK